MSEQLGPVVNNWRVRNVANLNATENGRVRIKTECFINSANGYRFAGLTVHGGASVDGQWATADRANVAIAANSGVGLVSKEIWVKRGKSARSVVCSAEVRVSGFAAGTSRSDIRITVPALPHGTVSYNANGGSGAPASQTKWWGELLTLSKTRPTRANHVFLGWSTSASGPVSYQPGAAFGSDGNTTLYAQWRLATKPPTISSFTAQRVNADGSPSDSGTDVALTAVWACDTAGDSTNAAQALKFARLNDTGAWVEFEATVSGASGTTTIIVHNLSADQSWQFRCTLTDKHGTATSHTTVGPQRFLLDFSADGKGIGVGVGAPAEGVAIAGSPVSINGCNVPRMFKGTKVVSPSASSNRHNLFMEAEWAAIVGEDIDAASAVVFVANGDLRANNIALTGAGWNQDDKRWYVFCGSATGAPFRVNYMIFI